MFGSTRRIQKRLSRIEECISANMLNRIQQTMLLSRRITALEDAANKRDPGQESQSDLVSRANGVALYTVPADNMISVIRLIQRYTGFSLKECHTQLVANRLPETHPSPSAVRLFRQCAHQELSTAEFLKNLRYLGCCAEPVELLDIN